MNIPQELQSKDSYSWTDSLADYPAPTWTLKYMLRGPASLDLTAVPSGSDHSLTLSSADSAILTQGTYQWQAVVTAGTDRKTVGAGTVKVLPALDQVVAGFEARSVARVTLENLEAILKKRSTQGYESVTIGGRSVTQMSWPDLLKAYNHFQALVRAEDQAENIAKGIGGKKIAVRFGEWA